MRGSVASGVYSFVLQACFCETLGCCLGLCPLCQGVCARLRDPFRCCAQVVLVSSSQGHLRVHWDNRN